MIEKLLEKIIATKIKECITKGLFVTLCRISDEKITTVICTKHYWNFEV